MLLVLGLTACGRPGPGANPSTPAPASPTNSAVASRSASSTNATFDLLPPSGGPPAVNLQISCSRTPGGSDPVALVQLHDGTTVLRDYADVNHPYTACSFGSRFDLQLLDARHLLVPGRGSNLYAVADLSQARVQWFQLPTQIPSLLAIAPSFDTVAWLTADLPSNTDEIHLTTHAGDRVVASVPNPHGGRCGSSEDSKSAGYSRSGQHLFVLDQPIPTLNSLVVLEGNRVALRVAPDSAPWTRGDQPAMALWSPTSDTLYYRKAGDVWLWTPAHGPQIFLPGVAWYYPTISPDGRHLAYAVAGADGLHDTYLVDLQTGGSPQRIGNGHRNLPAFLNSTQLWFKSESQGICGPGGNQPLVYDLGDGSESSTIVDMPIAVWPATSSNF